MKENKKKPEVKHQEENRPSWGFVAAFENLELPFRNVLHEGSNGVSERTSVSLLRAPLSKSPSEGTRGPCTTACLHASEAGRPSRLLQGRAASPLGLWGADTQVRWRRQEGGGRRIRVGKGGGGRAHEQKMGTSVLKIKPNTPQSESFL